MASRDLSPKVWTALIAVYTIWGSTYLAIKVVVRTMPPLLTAGMRFLIAGLVMYAIGIGRGDRAGDRPTAVHWRSAAIIGTALVFGGNGFVMLAEQRPLDSGTAALLVATIPLFLAVMDRVAFGERLRGRVIAGLVIGFVGTAFLVRAPGSDVRIDTGGALLCLLAATNWAAGSLYARRAPLPQRPIVSTGMEMIAGGLASLAAGALSGEIADVDVAAFSRESLLAFVYLVVFGSIIGFSAYVWLLRNVRITIVSTYAYVNPFVAVLLGVAILDERLTTVMLIGGAIIMAAVALIVGTKKVASDVERVAG